MWTALVLACISSLSFSESRVAPRGPVPVAFNQTQADLVTKNTSRETTGSILNKTSEAMTTPSPVTAARETSGANHSSPAATAGRTPGTNAYENYKKKDYTQVDYLINGMYADSEM
uniref:Uncharacterized protein n=1 Tax=Pipistrellus kuhlii TaxID=59472 RepID=A0A7J7WYQ5_PIPKU|nr:hypothetical protein mPipKuh1_001633 [Pipistrellus kuhlii]